MIKVKHFHDPATRALNCSLALGIHLNAAIESYGGTDSIRAMIGDEIVFHSKRSDVISWLCGMHKRLLSILSLLSSEGIDLLDENAVTDSLSETVQSKANKEFYFKYIKPNAEKLEL